MGFVICISLNPCLQQNARNDFVLLSSEDYQEKGMYSHIIIVVLHFLHVRIQSMLYCSTVIVVEISIKYEIVLFHILVVSCCCEVIRIFCDHFIITQRCSRKVVIAVKLSWV